jgi:hypothetical protein
MHPLLAARLREALHLGAGTLDTVHVTVACRRCHRFFDDPTVRMVDDARYTDLAELIEHAKRTASRVLSEPTAPCACGLKTSAVAVDYHAWHSAMGRDLVIRAHRRLFALDVELLWWNDVEGHVAAPPLTERQRHVVRRDACFRHIRATVQRSGFRAALRQLEEAAARFRGDPDLLHYGPQLLAAQRADLLAQIALSHVALNRQDADGHFWLAMALYHDVVRGALPRARLADAQRCLGKALDLAPDHADAGRVMVEIARAAAS